MTIRELQALDAVYPLIKEKTAPARFLYKMSKLMRQVANDLQFHAEEERKLLEVYAQKDENGTYKLTENQNGVLILPDKLEEFQQKYTDLLSVEYDNYNFQFTCEELEGLGLTFQEFQAFLPFIKEDVE